MGRQLVVIRGSLALGVPPGRGVMGGGSGEDNGDDGEAGTRG